MNKYHVMNGILKEEKVLERAAKEELLFAESEGDRFLNDRLDAVEEVWRDIEQ